MKMLWFLSGLSMLWSTHQIVWGDYMPPRWMVATAWFAAGVRLIAESIPGDD